ncbi:thaumatin-like protein 1b [Iris pallida]|uniref:Thaumatin-like protein 1b n=1 Tax=Iris pallida TaxID=29817 RepID=A0AAX6H5W0_IRIPA|nr:thaumatin-like protein 1b [Iris pallida]
MASANVLLSLHLLLLLEGSLSATFNIINNCDYTVWPGILSGAGTGQLQTTGFALPRGASQPVDIPSSWSGRLWGRTSCSSDPAGDNFTCATGDCGTSRLECSGSGAAPPATLAEFTLDGSGGLDFYDVSLVDGYNLPMLVVPKGGSGGNCTSTGCLVDLNPACPSDLRVVRSGRSVACRSACEAFGSAEYCCSGQYGNPDTCRPSQYSQFFKNACPRAYSYAYDDSTSTFTCAGADYDITFCPDTTSQKSGQDGNSTAVPLPLVNNTMVFLGGDEVSSSASSAVLPSVSVSRIMLLATSWLLIRLLFA